MTAARRVAALVELDTQQRALGGYERGGMQIDFVETVARYMVSEGADELWLRLVDPGAAGAAGLYDPLKNLAQDVFVPLVAWGAVRTASDARLVCGLGADRVVVSCSDRRLQDPVGTVAEIAQAVGPSAVSAAILVRRVAAKDSFTWEVSTTEGGMVGAEDGPSRGDAVAFATELAAQGAGELLLIPAFEGELSTHPTDLVGQLAARLPVQLVSAGREKETADLATPLLMGADGVLTQGLVRDGSTTFEAIKEVLLDLGVAVRPAEPPYLRPR